MISRLGISENVQNVASIMSGRDLIVVINPENPHSNVTTDNEDESIMAIIEVCNVSEND